MGCFNSTPAAPSSWQENGYQYHATYAQPQTMASYAAYAQPPPMASSGHTGHSVDLFSTPFLRMVSPKGISWAQYVQGAVCHVDPRGFLAGPWGECIQAAVQFEHHNDWNVLPEYAGREGPAGTVLMALDQWLGGNSMQGELMEAANRLEQAAHYAEDNGLPPPIDFSLQAVQAVPACAPGDAMAPYGYAHGAMPTSVPYGSGVPVSHAGAYYDYDSQAGPNFQQGYQPGPTLLQQQEQNQGGMGTGAKVAMGVAAAGAGVAAGALLASHSDEVGDAIGHVGEWAGEQVEGVEDFLEDIF